MLYLGMEKIYLSGKYSHIFTLVDTNDAKFLRQYKWYLNKFGYVLRNKRYKKNIPDKETFFMHRMILKIKERNIYTDHINGDKLDNRKENLRKCTLQENNFGRGKKKDNTSGYKGVYFNKDTQKWMARIAANNKRYYLGLFEKKEEAFKAYRKASLIYHGKYGRLT